MTQLTQLEREAILDDARRQGARGGKHSSTEVWGRCSASVSGMKAVLHAIGEEKFANEISTAFFAAADAADAKA